MDISSDESSTTSAASSSTTTAAAIAIAGAGGNAGGSIRDIPSPASSNGAILSVRKLETSVYPPPPPTHHHQPHHVMDAVSQPQQNQIHHQALPAQPQLPPVTPPHSLLPPTVPSPPPPLLPYSTDPLLIQQSQELTRQKLRNQTTYTTQQSQVESIKKSLAAKRSDLTTIQAKIREFRDKLEQANTLFTETNRDIAGLTDQGRATNTALKECEEKEIGLTKKLMEVTSKMDKDRLAYQEAKKKHEASMDDYNRRLKEYEMALTAHNKAVADAAAAAAAKARQLQQELQLQSQQQQQEQQKATASSSSNIPTTTAINDTDLLKRRHLDDTATSANSYGQRQQQTEPQIASLFIQNDDGSALKRARLNSTNNSTSSTSNNMYAASVSRAAVLPNSNNGSINNISSTKGKDWSLFLWIICFVTSYVSPL